MPASIKYSDNPNEETAFVTQEGGQRSRAVLTAALDGTIEYPDNPNSTKVMVTVDGVKRRAVAVANITGGGGGSVDYTKTVQRATTMPAASADNAGQQFLYAGATDATYTHDYIYESVATTTYSSTVSFEAATLSSSTIACSGDDFAAFVAEWGSGDITTITHGTLTYDQSGGLLVFVGKDAEETTVCTFQLYTEDYQDAGFTITGTLQDGDVFAFTTAITATISYAWARVDVQPTPEALPDQTGQSGKFLTTDGTSASWADITKVNTTGTLAVADWSSNTQTISVTGVTATSVVFVSPAPASASDYVSAGILCTAQAANSLTFTCDTVPSNAITVNVICF